jgi:carbamoyl-phosphate synthase/aspartate carbamoyltransferase
MVGYTESLTDPSYEGQILVLTYPLIGNYGVPPRPPPNYEELPAEFESSRIHIAALVVSYYSDDFSHFLATSSLGAWLKEQDVPAIYGVDTRALTKRIREKGSMLGRVLARSPEAPNGRARSLVPESVPPSRTSSPPSRTGSLGWREDYVLVPFRDPNEDNQVAAV